MDKRWGRRVGLGLLALLLAVTSVIVLPGRAGAVTTCNDPDPATQKVRRFVCAMYFSFLHEPSDAEVDYWTGIGVANGTPAVTHGMYNSLEAVQSFVGNDLYSDFLNNRAPDPGGLQFFTDLLLHGGKSSLETATVIVASSGEAFDVAGGTNSAWVDSLYTTILNRSSDTAGLAYWVAVLDAATVTRSDVVRAFITSDEATMSYVADDLYQSFLFRDPDSADAAAFWAGRVKAVGLRAVVEEFLNVDDVVVTFGND